MTRTFDCVVIGAGQAAPYLAVRLAKAGQRTALVERRRLGGTCVNDGCIPTKTLVASARAAWVVRQAARWGVEVGGPVRVDMKRVKERKDAIVAESIRNLERWLGGTADLTLIRGHARFVDPHAIEVGGERIEAGRFFLNTGARAQIPELQGLADVPFLTSTSILELDSAPPHLVVLGGSYVGLEFAQMFHRFGSQVTVLERGDRLLGRDDADVSTEIASILTDEGLTIHTGAEAVRVARADGGVAVTVERGDREERVAGSHLLIGLGRIPNTGDLGLDRAGVAVDHRGHVVVDDELRTSQPHVWALGDCNGRGAFTHTSYNDFEIVAGNLLDGDPRRVTDRIPIYALYIDPPLGRCGMTEAEARAAGHNLLVGKRPMTRVGRARERGETRGFLKIVVDADSKQLLGAALLGIEGDEAVHEIVDLMYARQPYTTLQRAVHAHPTVSELLPTVLGSLRPS